MMAGRTGCACSLATLQACCDHFDQPFLAHCQDLQHSHNVGHFRRPIACTEISLDTTAVLNNVPLPSPISVSSEWPEASAQLVGPVDQLAPAFNQYMCSNYTPCYPQNTWLSGEIQPSDSPSPKASTSIRPGSLSSLDSSPTHTARPNTQHPTSRKRSRPRLYSESSSEYLPSKSSDKAGVRRSAHNKVERKYREGLNAEIKRLQRVVPTMQHHDGKEHRMLGESRLSKTMILTGAIEYIKKIETERDAALEALGNWNNKQAFSARRNNR